MGNCQNYGPFLGPYYNTGPNTGPNLGDPKRDHNFDNPPCVELRVLNEGLKRVCWFGVQGSLVRSRGVSASTTIRVEGLGSRSTVEYLGNVAQAPSPSLSYTLIP